MGNQFFAIVFFLSMCIIHTRCSHKTSTLDYDLIMQFMSTNDSVTKAKIFTKQIMPAITANSPAAIANYNVCSQKTLTEKDFVPLMFVALFQRFIDDSAANEKNNTRKAIALILQDNTMLLPISDSIQTNYIVNNIISMCNARINDKEWLIALTTLLPEQSASVENIRGLICARLQAQGEPDFGEIADLVNAAYRSADD